MSYEIGKFYNVPTVHGIYWGIEGDWPVIGEFHEDSALIGFPDWHWHVDVRFIGKGNYEQLNADHNLGGSQYFVRAGPLMVHAGFLNSRKFTPTDRPPVVYKRRQCKREYHHSKPVDGAKWLAALEAAHADKTLAKGHCPHRGADISSLPVDRFGCIECPLYGLVFNARTGQMVPRATWNKWRREAATVPA